jgi:hypothetical protein
MLILLIFDLINVHLEEILAISLSSVVFHISFLRLPSLVENPELVQQLFLELFVSPDQLQNNLLKVRLLTQFK